MGGTKVLKVESGETAPDIVGKVHLHPHRLQGRPRCPRAPRTDVKTATNDASGFVDLGTISYTMESVFGSGSGEHKTFDYGDGVPARCRASSTTSSSPAAAFTVTVTDNRGRHAERCELGEAGRAIHLHQHLQREAFR